MISLANFEPYELGLPEKFTKFRPAQIEAIEHFINDGFPFELLDLPTGSGKTLIAMAIAKALGMRTVVLTSTLGLQEQYLKDFAESGLVDIRGKNNYDCCNVNATCRYGAHEGCKLCQGPQSYGESYKRAVWSPLVITNYAYWIRANEKTRGLEPPPSEGENPVELLVLDEAHRASEELSRTLQVVLREAILKKHHIEFKRYDDVTYWLGWANSNQTSIDVMASEAKRAYKLKRTKVNKDRFYELDALKQVVDSLINIDVDTWVCEPRDIRLQGRQYAFDPIWPADHSRKLFCGVPRVLMMSATLRPIAARMLGIKKDLYRFRDWPRVFPAELTPIYHVPTVRLNHKATPEHITKWVERIDEIISGRLDRKGLLHTVSYDRQRYLLAHSKFARHMVANTSEPDSDSASEVFEKFKLLPAPSILVSPSFSTGWDFPGDDCRYQIIAKLPFPDSRNKLMQARLERNPQYVNSLAMQDLQQAAGRGTRSETDWCEVFIVDDSIGWFFQRNKALASRWFSITHVANVPHAKELESPFIF